jgi:hypothetical protein
MNKILVFNNAEPRCEFHSRPLWTSISVKLMPNRCFPLPVRGRGGGRRKEAAACRGETMIGFNSTHRCPAGRGWRRRRRRGRGYEMPRRCRACLAVRAHRLRRVALLPLSADVCGTRESARRWSGQYIILNLIY